MLAAVIFSNNIWTFWDVFLLFFVFIPLVMLWFFCMFDVFGRRDIGGWAKALWLVAIVVLPWVGSLAYLIFRPMTPDSYPPEYNYEGTGRGAAVPVEPKGKVPAS